MGYIYIASPYTHKDEYMVQKNFEVVELYIAQQLKEQPRTTLFSPIVHTHALSNKYSVRTEFEYWSNHNFNMIKSADKLKVLCLPGWEHSKGVKCEIDYALSINCPVSYITCDDLLRDYEKNR